MTLPELITKDLTSLQCRRILTSTLTFPRVIGAEKKDIGY
jgi:hypothetical protein